MLFMYSGFKMGVCIYIYTNTNHIHIQIFICMFYVLNQMSEVLVFTENITVKWQVQKIKKMKN